MKASEIRDALFDALQNGPRSKTELRTELLEVFAPSGEWLELSGDTGIPKWWHRVLNVVDSMRNQGVIAPHHVDQGRWSLTRLDEPLEVEWPEFWTPDTSVLFTTFWGWSPDTWASVGWSDERGKARRNNLLKELTDPFITVCGVTNSGEATVIDPTMRGMVVGFYLVSHVKGDRDEFSHPLHHSRSPESWRHSLLALRAFSYVPEYRIRSDELIPDYAARARPLGSMGDVLTDMAQISTLVETPWYETDIYLPTQIGLTEGIDEDRGSGWVRGGPQNQGGYTVSAANENLPRHLYILRLQGDNDAFLGYPSDGCCIYKIGLSRSPQSRRQHFQKAIPRGAYRWQVERTTKQVDSGDGYSFEAAIAGENAMKKLLGTEADHLGGEFYLASKQAIDRAWEVGCKASAVYHSNIDCE